MKRLMVLTATLGLLFVAGTASAQNAKVEKGKALFASSGCKMCHSIAGQGNVKGSLDDVGSKLTAAEIKSWLTDPSGMMAKTHAERKPPMKLAKPLSAEDVDALVAYLETLKKK